MTDPLAALTAASWEGSDERVRLAQAEHDALTWRLRAEKAEAALTSSLRDGFEGARKMFDAYFASRHTYDRDNVQSGGWCRVCCNSQSHPQHVTPDKLFEMFEQMRATVAALPKGV